MDTSLWICVLVFSHASMSVTNGNSIEPIAPIAGTERAQLDITCRATITSKFEGLRLKKLKTGGEFENILMLRPPEFNPDPFDTTKYSIKKLDSTSFVLTIKEATFEDARRYRCGLIVDDQTSQLTTVVVVRPPTLMVTQKVKVGEMTSMSCDVHYQVPHDLDRSTESDKFPQISATIGGVPQTGERRDTLGNLKMTWNTTLSEGDDQKEVVCRAYTKNPNYEVTTSKVLDVLFDVRNIKLDPIQEMYYIGDKVNCTAEGNPQPERKWVAVKTKTVSKNIGQSLLITEAMAGGETKEEWKCVASNSVSGAAIEQIESLITFVVVQPTAPPPEEQKESPTAAIAAGVAVPLILIIVAAVVALVILRNKKKKRSFKPPDTENQPDPEPVTSVDPNDETPVTQPLKPIPSTRQPKPNTNGHNVSFSELDKKDDLESPDPAATTLLDEQGKPRVPDENEKPKLAELAAQVGAHGGMPQSEQQPAPVEPVPVATEYPDIAAAHPGLQQVYSKPKPKPRPRKPPDTTV